MLCTAFAMAVAGCSSGDIPLPASRDKVILSLGVQLGDIIGNQARSAEEEAKEGEIMKSLRVIVLDADGTWNTTRTSLSTILWTVIPIPVFR